MSEATLRILLVLENAGSGSGRHVIDLARGLLAGGHDVTLLYSRARIERWFEAELGALPNLHTATINMRPGLGLRDAPTVAAVRRFCKAMGPFDVIHGHSSKAGAMIRLATPGLPGVRVYTPHAFYTLGAQPGSARARFFGLLERVLSRFCDGIICVSQAEYRHAVALGLPVNKLYAVPNGFDTPPPGNRDAVRAQLALKDHHVCVGFVGRLARQKSVHRLVDAFASAHTRAAHLRLVIVGFGPDEEALKARAQAAGVADAIVWTGEADGLAMMSAFDIFALPSLYEAFPYVLLEAMSRALPILSTRVGGVDELVHDGENGFVVEQNDAASLAARLTELGNDLNQCQAFGAVSARIVMQFDVATMVAKTTGVYRTLLQRAADPPPATN